MSPVLRLAVHHERSIKHFALPRSEAVLGAATACDLVAPYPGVSRRHVSIRPLDGGLLITDLGSKNGLIKDGTRFAEVLLRPRDRVRIGKAWLELEEVDSSEAAVGIPFAAGPTARRRSGSSDTGQLSDAPGAGSPAAALGLVRVVEAAGGIDPMAPAPARALLEMARATLGAKAVWIWTLGPGGSPSILAVAGDLPDESALQALAATALIPATHDGAGRTVASSGTLVSMFDAAARGLAALLIDGTSKVPSWKLDLFEYLAARVGPGARSTGEPSLHVSRPEPGELRFPENFVHGVSVAMTRLIGNLAAVAWSRLDVLLLGETGTGKELLARTVHLSGPTRTGPFLAIHCAAGPPDLLEARLFGGEARGVAGFDPGPGLFERAAGGSLFLDEIGDLPEPLQAKLLHTLESREILPLGAAAAKKIDVRVISASNRNLGELARAGRFRADLYYRLRGLQFHIPPLRDRREDLPALVLTFAQNAAHEYDKSIQGVSRKALALLAEYDWPGNVRELENEVERAVLLCPNGSTLESGHFAPVAWALEQQRERRAPDRAAPGLPLVDSLHAPPRSLTLQSHLDELERRLILEALARSSGNKSQAAKLLGVTRNGLALKIKRLGLAP